MNESNGDRVFRVIVGVVLLIAGFTALNGALAVVAVIVGAILTVTGTVGFCPIYKVFRTGTRKLSEA